MGNSQLSLFSFQNQQKESFNQIQSFEKKATFNPERQTFIRIASCNQKQSQYIMQNICCYQNKKCHSLPKLKEYYHAKNNQINIYCSKQQFFYIVFEGCNCCSLKEQFNFRRLNSRSFTQREIKNILSTFLCAVREYFQVLKRDLDKIQLQDISFNHKSKLYMKDPWLRKFKQAISVNQVNILLQYPSPERLQFQNQIQESFNNFFSLLFSIGVIGLQLLQMNFVDDLYLKHPKQFNFQKMKQLLRRYPHSQLKSGIQILLSIKPEDRNKIYSFWRIECQNQQYLQRLQSRNHETLTNKQSSDTEKSNRINRSGSYLKMEQQSTNYFSKPTQSFYNFNHINNKIGSRPIRFQESVVTKEIQTIRQKPVQYQVSSFQPFYHIKNNQYRSHSLAPEQRSNTYKNFTNVSKDHMININRQNSLSMKQAPIINFNNDLPYIQKNQSIIQFPKYEKGKNQMLLHKDLYEINRRERVNNFNNFNNIHDRQHREYNIGLAQTNKTIPYYHKFNYNIQQTINLRKPQEKGQNWQKSYKM